MHGSGLNEVRERWASFVSAVRDSDIPAEEVYFVKSDFRSCFNMIDQEALLVAVKEFLGHTTSAASRRY